MVDFSDIDIQPTAADVATRVMNWLIDRVAAGSDPVRVALSGGSTPKALFALLAKPENAARMAWAKLHLFWGDERFVTYDSADSNFGECKRILLDHVPMPAGNIHPVPCDGTPDDAAARYAAMLQAAYGATEIDPGRPIFDVNFLGLGEDGHTASLIPGQPVLQERSKWVAAVGQGRPEVRLTMTYPVLESAAVVAFIVAGAAKRAIVQQVKAGADVPAGRLAPAHATIWFMDRAASGQGARYENQ